MDPFRQRIGVVVDSVFRSIDSALQWAFDVPAKEFERQLDLLRRSIENYASILRYRSREERERPLPRETIELLTRQLARFRQGTDDATDRLHDLQIALRDIRIELARFEEEFAEARGDGDKS